MLGEIDVPTLVLNVQPVVNAPSGSLFFKLIVSRSQLTDWTHVNVHIHQHSICIIIYCSGENLIMNQLASILHYGAR